VFPSKSYKTKLLIGKLNPKPKLLALDKLLIDDCGKDCWTSKSAFFNASSRVACVV